MYVLLVENDCFLSPPCRTRLQQRLGEAQEKVVTLLSARMQVHGSLTDWLL